MCAGGAGPLVPWQRALWEHEDSTCLSWSCCPHPESLAGAEEAGRQGELSGARFPYAVLPLLSLGRGGRGDTEGWAEAPLSSRDRDQEPEAGPLPGPRFPRSEHWLFSCPSENTCLPETLSCF